MLILNPGNSATVTLTDYDSVTVQTRGVVTVEAVSGLGVTAGVIAQLSGSRTFGPYSAGQIKLTASAADVLYDVQDGADNGDRPYNPAGVAAFASAYIGQVATHCFLPTSFSAPNKQAMSRTRHVAQSPICGAQLAFANFQGAEIATGAAATITASIEYPAGTFTQVKFGGSTSGSIADGSFIISDPVAVLIPEGAAFFVRAYYTNTAGIVYTATAHNTALGEAMTYGASGVVDQTMGGTVTATVGGLGFGPIAILGLTVKPSILIVGDSRGAGQNDSTSGSTSDVGEIARSLTGLAYMNLAVPGDKAQTFLTTSKRAIFGSFASHVICEYGINDLNASRTAAQLLADIQVIRALFPNKKFYQSTVAPYSSSTDAWATTVNQTPGASNAQRIVFNNAVRAIPSGFAGYFEVADTVESARDGGVWKVGFTSDGIHATPSGYAAIAASGAINPASLTRY